MLLSHSNCWCGRPQGSHPTYKFYFIIYIIDNQMIILSKIIAVNLQQNFYSNFMFKELEKCIPLIIKLLRLPKIVDVLQKIRTIIIIGVIKLTQKKWKKWKINKLN